MIVLHSGVLRAATLALICGAALASRADEPSPQLKALLAKLPAERLDVRGELLALEPADIRALCGMLVEPGTADDNPARLALHGLALALGDPGQAARRATFVQTLGEVLNGESPPRDGPFVIEQLQLGGGRSAVNALGRTLTHERWCADAARGLAAVGGEQALQVLHAALPSVGADCRPAVIAALGELGDPASATELLKDARSGDRAVRLLTLHALARSGDPQALDTLRQTAETDSWYERSQATDALLTYADRLAELNHADQGAEILRDLLRTRTAPGETHVRCATLHGLARHLGVQALGDLVAGLEDENTQVRAAAANAAAALPGPQTTAALLGALAQANPRGRAGILDVLARRNDTSAFATAASALQDPDHEVRLAAIAAAARLGGDGAVTPLIGVLDTAEADERQAAQDALVRVPGPQATQVIADAVAAAPPQARALLLDVLAARPRTGDLAAIFAAAQDGDVAVRAAALRALAALGDEPALARVLELLVTTETEEDRTAAAQAVAAIGRRFANRERATAQVINAMEGRSVPVRAALLHALGQLGGHWALEAVRAALGSKDPTLREAGVRAWSEWPDAEPAPAVLDFARQTDDPRLQVLAVRAYIRMIGLMTDRPPAERLELYVTALQTARRPEEKKLVLAQLGQIKELDSLQRLEPYVGDEALGAEAVAASLSIVEALLSAHAKDLRSPLEKLVAAAPTPELRGRAEATLKRLEQYEGYITDWWVAGPYVEQDKPGRELMDQPFPPEEPDATGVQWRKQPVGQGAEALWTIDLHATMRGDNRAGYLFTRVCSPQAQKARLEVGSDDGIKVWLTGKVVHTNNALRGMVPGDDKVPVSLHEGWNTLLLKVTNDSGAWAACARFRSPDGGNLPGVYAEAGEKP